MESRQLFDLDSTNMRPEHWLQIAACIEEDYDRYDGFVVTHGTDTLAYTAAALSYLVQRSIKPVVLTGAQKSIYTEDTDARRNLLDAFTYASDARSHGVCVVFDGQRHRRHARPQDAHQEHERLPERGLPGIGRRARRPRAALFLRAGDAAAPHAFTARSTSACLT